MRTWYTWGPSPPIATNQTASLARKVSLERQGRNRIGKEYIENRWQKCSRSLNNNACNYKAVPARNCQWSRRLIAGKIIRLQPMADHLNYFRLFAV